MENHKLFNSHVCLIENFFNADYEWQNFIDCINENYDLNSLNNGIYGAKEVVGNVNFWQKLTVTMDKISETNFKGLDDKINQLKILHEGNYIGGFGAVSFTNKEQTTGKHSDPMDVIYCQFIGSVTWNIFYEGKEDSFTLNAGDILYVPKSVIHEVSSLSPRAALSFMFEAK